jgi:hypothetical protein
MSKKNPSSKENNLQNTAGKIILESVLADNTPDPIVYLQNHRNENDTPIIIPTYIPQPSIQTSFLNSFSKDGLISVINSDQLNLQTEINTLKKEITDLIKSAENERTNKNEIQKKYEELLEQLTFKEKTNHIVPRICEEARKFLFRYDSNN